MTVSLCDNRSNSSDSFCLSDASSSKTYLSDFRDSYVSDNLNKQNEDNLSNSFQIMSILYTNADSLFNKRDELEVEIFVNHPDIIIVTEAFHKNVDSREVCEAELKIVDFNLIKSLTLENSRGVCIFTRQYLSVSDCKVLNNFDLEESCWCILNLNSGEKLLLGAIYRSPSSSSDNDNQLIALVDTAYKMKFDYTILIGDFNYPTIEWSDWTSPHGTTNIVFYLIECLLDHYL